MSVNENTLTTDILTVDDVAASTQELKQSYSEQSHNEQSYTGQPTTPNNSFRLRQIVDSNCLDSLTKLIESGLKIDDLYYCGQHIIWHALTDEKAKILELLLQNGADPNDIRKRTMNSPLLAAYKKEQYKVVELLFNYGANINYSTKYNKSMLTESIRYRDIEMFKYLIARGVDLNSYYDRSNPEKTIVDHIIVEKRHNFLKILIESDCKFNLRSDQFMYLIDLCIRCGKEITIRYERNIELKRFAFYKEMLDLVDLILKRRVFDPKWVPTNEEDISPLQRAIESENEELARILVFNGADLDAVYLSEETSSNDPRKILMEIISEDYYKYRRNRSKFYRKRHEFDEDKSDIEDEQQISQNTLLNKTAENFVKFDCKTFYAHVEFCDVFDEERFFRPYGRRQEKKSYTTSDHSDDEFV